MAYCILRTDKLKTPGIIAASLSHSYRDRPTENADPARKQQNEPSDDRTAAEVLAGIEAQLPVKRRRDAVLCIEYFFGASPEYFSGHVDGTAYFEAAKRWLIEKHGAANVIFSIVHRDELTPHCVGYVVPIYNGTLNAKHFLGSKTKLSAMQTNFAKAVGQRFGLQRGIEGSAATHTTVRQFYATINGPPPPIPVIKVAMPPLIDREQWAESESKRITATLLPILEDAAKAARWGRFQAKDRQEAQLTAQQQADKVAAVQAEAQNLRVENQRLIVALEEWVCTFDEGLTNDQAAELVAMADRMRLVNRLAAAEPSKKPEDHSEDGAANVPHNPAPFRPA